MTTTSFLPEGYELTKTFSGGKYFKLQDWETAKIRVLTSSILGYEYFRKNQDGSSRPVRQKEPFEWIPADSKDWNSPKEFRAFWIYNYETNSIQVWEITRYDIKQDIMALYKDSDFWDPKGYDLKVSRTGKDYNNTKYTIMPLNKSPFEDTEMLKQAGQLRLEALYDWEDPFKPF